MTASSGRQQNRVNNIVNQVDKYNNSDLSNDLRNYINNNIGKYGIYKSSYNNANNQKALNDFTNNQKQNLQNYLDNNFYDLGGSNTWVNKYYDNNFGQNNVNNLLDTQYNAALEQIDRAQKRGLLSDTGYQSALNNLNNQYSSGYSSVNNINQGILDDFKNELTETAQGYMTDLGNYNLGKYGTMNTQNWSDNLQNVYDNQQNNYQSQFDNATQGMNLFDTSNIINNARVEQGVNNAQTDELESAIDDNFRQKNKKAGLGNTGVF